MINYITFSDGYAQVKEINEDEKKEIILSENICDSNAVSDLLEILRTEDDNFRGDYSNLKSRLLTPEKRKNFFYSHKQYLNVYSDYEDFALRIVIGYSRYSR